MKKQSTFLTIAVMLLATAAFSQKTWTGATSTQWNYDGNWSPNGIPTAKDNVTIPSAPANQPVISGTSLPVCKNLKVKEGALLTIKATSTSNAQLTVTGTAIFDGGLTIGGHPLNSVKLTVTNIVWYSTATVETGMTAQFEVSGDWTFSPGSSIDMGYCTVTFLGTGNSVLNSNSAGSKFGSLKLGKTATASTSIGSSSVALNINGDLQINAGNTFVCGYNIPSIIKGNININGLINFYKGTISLEGTSAIQSVQMATTTNNVNNLTINCSGTANLNNSLNVLGNLIIQNGTFDPQNNTLYVTGNWNNMAGPEYFIEGTGKVVFNGSGYQYVNSSEYFNILEVNMGDALRVDNLAITVTCNQYDWTSGGIDVLAGTFTALDLADNGLYGSYSVKEGGTINLHQDASQYIDLSGKLNFDGGGTINVYGGHGISYWPYPGNAEIYMNGGVLDFKAQGIYIPNSSTFTFIHNITGGTIRTSKGLICDKTDFTPAGGTFEFYGSSDGYLSMESGSQLRNVVVDKSSKEGDEIFTGEPVYDQRSGRLLSEGTMANDIILYSDIDILGNLTINAGSLTLNGKKLNIKQNCFVSGTLNMTDPGDVITVGQSSADQLEFKSGSIANITAGIINIYGWIIPQSGSLFNPTPGNTVVIKGESGGGLSNSEPSATYGNVILQKNSCEWSCIDFLAAESIVINGTFNISSGNKFYMNHKNLIVNGTFTDSPTSEIYMGEPPKNVPEYSYSTGEEPIHSSSRGGSLTINSDYTINGLLDIANGNALLTKGFGINSTGVLKINGGSFINNTPSIGNWTFIQGSLQLADGLFELTNNYPFFFSGSNSVISGGTIRTVGSFGAIDTNVFKPTGGIVEITGSNVNGAIHCYNGNYFHDLVINRSALSSIVYGGELTINNDLTINKGGFSTSSSLVTVSGNVAINNDGQLLVGAGGGLAIAESKSVTVNNGGLIEFNGTAGTLSKITRNSSGYYALNIESGGKIGAKYTIFEYMNTNGVNIKPGAIVDLAKSFSNCIFRNGQSGGRLLTINNSQTFSVNYAMFPTNSGYGSRNVFKYVDSGVVTFGGHSGDFSGKEFEWDTHNRIHWEGDVEDDVALRGVDVVSGQDICFDATNTLTIAGGGNTFVVQNGGNVNLIAGNNIRMLEGTSVHSGAYLHAYISNEYCTLPPAMLAAEEDTDAYNEIVSEKSSELFETKTNDLFRVYPNPTTGIFTLELNTGNDSGSVRIEIFNLLGERIFNSEQQTNSHYQFDLSGNKAGVYFIRVNNAGNIDQKKLIKQ